MINEINGRTVIFKALTGSRNYNTNLPTSDKDYKIYVLPTLEDLYNGDKYVKAYKDEENNEEGTIYDIRLLSDHFNKPSINFLEILFSTDLKINNKLNPRILYNIKKLLEMKYDIVKIDLPKLYHVCHSTIIANYQHFIKTKNPKDAHNVIRTADFLYTFSDIYNFHSFDQAIRYKNGSLFRDVLLDIKSGNIKYNTLLQMVESDVNRHILYKEKYNKPRNEETVNKVNDIVKDIIISHIKSLI